MAATKKSRWAAVGVVGSVALAGLAPTAWAEAPGNPVPDQAVPASRVLFSLEREDLTLELTPGQTSSGQTSSGQTSSDRASSGQAASGAADLVLGAADKTSVPDDGAYALLGRPGEDIWLLDGRGTGAAAPQWETTAIAADRLAGDGLHWALTGIEGPGDVKVIATGRDRASAERDGTASGPDGRASGPDGAASGPDGAASGPDGATSGPDGATTGPDGAPSAGDAEAAPEVLFDSADGLPDVRPLPAAEHGDLLWAFTAPGEYRISSRATAELADGHSASADTVWTVQVTDEEPAAPHTGTGGGEPGAAPVSRTGPGPATEARTVASRAEKAAGDPVADEKTVIDDGHVDAVAAKMVDGELRALFKDSRDPSDIVWREPSSVVLHVNPQAKEKVPAGDTYAFLGTAGSDFWLIPQVQKQGVVWAGWNTEALGGSDLKGPIDMKLTKVDGPGTLAIWETAGLGGAQVLYNSADGLPDTQKVSLGVHAHANWGFSEEGTYAVTFQLSGTLANGKPSTDTRTYTFAVGDVDPNAVTPGGGGSDGGSTGGSGGSGATGGGSAGSGARGTGSAGSGTGGGSADSTGGGGSADSTGGGGSADSTEGGGSSDGTGGKGSLAHTGAGSPLPLGLGAGALVLGGGAALVIGRANRRRTTEGPAAQS
ncbi:choice-of-anchor M domain-containing protein [Streptomyces halstedii]|uniref:choice-of-anchor M domain-containing protein n=1 Tax=Streptomyces halstedii TaxID=1944 RepID=UPI0037D8735B